MVSASGRAGRNTAVVTDDPSPLGSAKLWPPQAQNSGSDNPPGALRQTLVCFYSSGRKWHQEAPGSQEQGPGCTNGCAAACWEQPIKNNVETSWLSNQIPAVKHHHQKNTFWPQTLSHLDTVLIFPNAAKDLSDGKRLWRDAGDASIPLTSYRHPKCLFKVESGGFRQRGPVLKLIIWAAFRGKPLKWLQYFSNKQATWCVDLCCNRSQIPGWPKTMKISALIKKHACKKPF